VQRRVRRRTDRLDELRRLRGHVHLEPDVPARLMRDDSELRPRRTRDDELWSGWCWDGELLREPGGARGDVRPDLLVGRRRRGVQHCRSRHGEQLPPRPILGDRGPIPHFRERRSAARWGCGVVAPGGLRQARPSQWRPGPQRHGRRLRAGLGRGR
jgi:hypothetical protein